MKLPAETALDSIEGIPRQKLAPLRRLGLISLGDLLRHFPHCYEDRRAFDKFPTGPSESAVCLFGVVAKTSARRFGPRRVFEVLLEEDGGNILSAPMLCRWYNMPWVPNMVATGDRLVVFGKPRLRSKQIVMEHPDFEVIEEESGPSIHFDRITPIHPAGDGVSPRWLRSQIHRALEITDLTTLPILWPDDHPISPDVWRAIHFPLSDTERESAREQLVREEFFGLQMIVCARHVAVKSAGGVSRPGTGDLRSKVRAALPFQLTDSQLAVGAEISADMAAPTRMNRLLQGDVGSGKTMVALMAMLQACESGWQAALMAPTQILAEQHYMNFRRLLDPLGIPVALRTSSKREHSASADSSGGRDGNGGLAPPCSMPTATSFPPLIIGTHALLFDSARFEKLGLVVIDEQHKFGVLQRSRLIARGNAPDVLVMTATPIPRTITQTLYGDLDVSILREKPAGRGKIITAVRDASKLPDIIRFFKEKISEGRQAYVVYPLIEESESRETKAAKAEFEKWRELVAPATVGLVHGRLDNASKESVMAQFRDGAISVLVATTVIEVGVDVPNACLMLIEDAATFGLSQLHQLRGRIGRGAGKSYCVLLHSGSAGPSKEKLDTLEMTSDGFEIAEADLLLRGPGDMLGTAQTGLPPLNLGSLIRDGEIMNAARLAARRILQNDPCLERPENAHLRAHVEKSSSRISDTAG